MTDWYLRACARLRAHNRRYEAVCETQPRQYSIVWMDWWVNASPKSNSCNEITSNKATCLIYQMPISVMVEISFCIEFQKISNSQTTKEAILLINYIDFFKLIARCIETLDYIVCITYQVSPCDPFLYILNTKKFSPISISVHIFLHC